MRFLAIPLAALLLAGCVVVPLGYHARPPRRVTYIHPYPVHPHLHGWYGPRYYGRGRW